MSTFEGKKGSGSREETITKKRLHARTGNGPKRGLQSGLSAQTPKVELRGSLSSLGFRVGAGLEKCSVGGKILQGDCLHLESVKSWGGRRNETRVAIGHSGRGTRQPGRGIGEGL